MYSGLEWPKRFFGGGFHASSSVKPLVKRGAGDCRATNVVILNEDAAFSFHSSLKKLCGLQHQRVDVFWVAVWGTSHAGGNHNEAHERPKL